MPSISLWMDNLVKKVKFEGKMVKLSILLKDESPLCETSWERIKKLKYGG